MYGLHSKGRLMTKLYCGHESSISVCVCPHHKADESSRTSWSSPAATMRVAAIETVLLTQFVTSRALIY